MILSRFTRASRVHHRNLNPLCVSQSPKHTQFSQFPASKSGERQKSHYSGWSALAGAAILTTAVISYQILTADEEKTAKPITPTIRELKDPNELFKYYSSVERDGQYLMTTPDFIRFIIPNSDINEALIGKDGCSEEHKKNFELVNNIFNSIDLNNDGLICYSEFMFFITLLSIPPKYFRLAFRLFDEDRSGSVDKQEFNKILRLVQHANPISGSSNSTPQSKQKITEADELDSNYPIFFGIDGKKQLTFPEFEAFILQLRNKISLLQFSLLSKGKDSIPAKDYAINLVSYIDPRFQHEYDKRIDALSSSDIKIVFEDHNNFNLMLESLEDIDFALRSFVALGQPFTKTELRRAASAASTVKLTDNLLDLIFELFDKNGDGKLDSQEFIGALQSKQHFGFTKPRDSGVVRAARCMQYCWCEEIYCRYAKPV